MDSKTISILAIVGVGGYIAYSLYKQGKTSTSPQYNPTGGYPMKTSTGFDYEKALSLIMDLYDRSSTLYGDLTKSKKATADLQSLIAQGKSQQQIEAYMLNVYGFQPYQTQQLVNKLYK